MPEYAVINPVQEPGKYFYFTASFDYSTMRVKQFKTKAGTPFTKRIWGVEHEGQKCQLNVTEKLNEILAPADMKRGQKFAVKWDAGLKDWFVLMGNENYYSPGEGLKPQNTEQRTNEAAPVDTSGYDTPQKNGELPHPHTAIEIYCRLAKKAYETLVALGLGDLDPNTLVGGVSNRVHYDYGKKVYDYDYLEDNELFDKDKQDLSGRAKQLGEKAKGFEQEKEIKTVAQLRLSVKALWEQLSGYYKDAGMVDEEGNLTISIGDFCENAGVETYDVDKMKKAELQTVETVLRAESKELLG